MKKNSYRRLLAQRLSRLTKEANMPLKDLAEEMEISVGALSNYQNGKAEPGLTSLCAIADYFEVPVDWLVGRSQVRDPKASEASVCEYLRLSQEAVRFLRMLTDGAKIESGRVRATEISDWLFEQEEFRMLLISIWISVEFIEHADDGKTNPQLLESVKHFITDLCDPKYLAMSSLVHLLDDRTKDYLKRRELNG